MHLRTRAFVLAALLAIANLALPCAMMAAAPVEDHHACCDDESPAVPAPPSDCEWQCAVGDLPFTSTAEAAVSASADLVSALTPTVAQATQAPPHASASAHPPPQHGPPAYVRHAALLI